MIRKVIGWGLFLCLLVYISRYPAQAADAVKGIFSKGVDMFSGFGAFFAKVVG